MLGESVQGELGLGVRRLVGRVNAVAQAEKQFIRLVQYLGEKGVAAAPFRGHGRERFFQAQRGSVDAVKGQVENGNREPQPK